MAQRRKILNGKPGMDQTNCSVSCQEAATVIGATVAEQSLGRLLGISVTNSEAKESSYPTHKSA
jgi:hypothetical protein